MGDYEKRIVFLNVKDFFENKKVIDRIARYDSVIITNDYGGHIIINMDNVTFIDIDDETIDFYFLNETRITLHKNGKMDFTGSEYRPGYYVISSDHKT
jgi:hypothetical protein